MRDLGRCCSRYLAMALAGVILASGLPSSARAGTTWDSLRAEIYGSRPIADGSKVVTLSAPQRPEDMRAVPLAAKVTLAAGQTVKAVSFIVDENPSPLAAVVRYGGERDRVMLGTNIRLAQQTMVRVVVETRTGDLYMVSQLVKFAGGQSACAAPPSGDPAEIAANMGRMDVALLGAEASMSAAVPRARLAVRHPNHTGMVLDQLTLLYTPLLMVSRIEVRQGDDLVLEVDGSITLSENPVLDFDYRPNGATELTVDVRDTSGGAWRKSWSIGPQS